jgi:DNA-binding MarR family transcriptional regulator
LPAGNSSADGKITRMDDEGAIRLRRVIVKVARQLNASSTGAGLTPSQASVLGLIVARGPMSLPDVGELEGINPTMLSRVIGRLVELNLIDRVPDPADLRSVSVVAATDGRRIDKQIKARRAAAVSQCLELLPADDVAALSAALPALENLAETMRQVGAPERHRVRAE